MKPDVSEEHTTSIFRIEQEAVQAISNKVRYKPGNELLTDYTGSSLKTALLTVTADITSI
jgi:hypothetical protein